MHLVWKRHPEGGFKGLGISPLSIILFFFLLGSGIGTAESKASVYGCTGWLYMSAEFPISTIFPRYMTAILLLIYSTTLKSWVINRYVRPNSFCRSLKRFIIWAWMETSSADIGSSAMINLGFKARALAIPILCLCPPLNSWG